MCMEKNVHSAFAGWRVLHMSVRSGWSSVLCKSYFLMHHLLSVGFSVIECGLLKSPTVTAELTIVSFSSVNICFIYYGALMFGAYMLVTVLYSW